MLLSCSPAEKAKAPDINQIATDYVKLVLEVGQYDGDFVDAYYGPDNLKPATELPEGAIFEANDYLLRADDLRNQLDQLDETSFRGLEKARLNMLKKQLLAVRTKISMMGGAKYSFDEEAKLLYDAEPPTYSQDYFDSLLAGLDEVLPGKGNVSERYTIYAKNFIIPKEKLDTVFQTAITEARKRTDAQFQLPENENFVLEYVNDKSWSGYNYYQGKSQSLIQLNTDFPIFIERAIDLACHEGYPGHHVFNALLEQNLVDSKGWVEFSVYPLFSPQSLIAEGSANYGIDVAFPGATRIAYEKEVLFPLAGINPARADRYYRIQALRAKLNYAGNEAARKYLNGEISREEAASWLEKYLLYEPDRALQRTRFIDQYRSYVINYNLGKDLVANYIEAKGGTADQPKRRWEAFKELLSNPHTASTLK
ncbi:MAG: hypothetical protein Roseis2KO_39700 [Roseivirga sp.]